ncbi:uncharacterized protein LY79DRAFT_540365, partial [Colletotrichum navitas]
MNFSLFVFLTLSRHEEMVAGANSSTMYEWFSMQQTFDGNDIAIAVDVSRYSMVASGFWPWSWTSISQVSKNVSRYIDA